MASRRCDGQETRRKLLAAASEIFARRGFTDATVAEICRAAGANIAAVNYYFGTKETLYAEAWRHAFETSLEKYPPDGGVPPQAPPTERLRGQIRALLSRVMDPTSLGFEIARKELATPTGLLREVMRRSIDPLKARTRAVVRELLGPGADEEDVRLCESSVTSQCFAPLHHRHCQAASPGVEPDLEPRLDEIPLDRLVEHVTAFSLAGIAALRASRPAAPTASRPAKRKKKS